MKTPPQVVYAVFGGVRATARALGIDPGAVSRWNKRGKVPQDHHRALLRIAKQSRKRLTAVDLILGRG